MRGCLSHSSIYAMPTSFCVPWSNNREDNQHHDAGGSREIKGPFEEPFHIFLSERAKFGKLLLSFCDEKART